jgi:AcrR family transcriptional regulator
MSDNHPSPRRQKKIASRLDQILEAASRLFAEKGFHRTTTKEIAQAADVAEGTLYNYFENKDDLLIGILGRLAESQKPEAQLGGSLPMGTRQLFIALFQSNKDFSEKHTTMRHAILSEILSDAELRERYYQQMVKPTLTMLEKQLKMRTALGQIRPIDEKIAARFIASLWTGLFILQTLGDPIVDEDWDALVEESASIIFDGVCPT